MLKQTLLLAIVSCLMLAGSAQATVLFDESFDYTADTQLDASGAWTTTLGDGTGHMVRSPGLSYTGLDTAGNRVVGLGTTNSDQSVSTANGALVHDVFSVTDTYYYTMLLDGTDAQQWLYSSYAAAEANQTLMRFLKSGSSIRMRVEVDGAAMSDVNAVERPTISPIAGGNPILVAAKIVHTAGTTTDPISVVYNPDLSQSEATIFGSPDHSADFNISQAAAVDGVIELRLNYTTDNEYDEIRIATTWAEALGIPEPATMLVLGVGAMLALLRRRR